MITNPTLKLRPLLAALLLSVLSAQPVANARNAVAPSMPRIVSSETTVEGGQAVQVKLPAPVFTADEGWDKTGRKETPLLPAGLLGPVTSVAKASVSVEL
jgi:hypothetical protein